MSNNNSTDFPSNLHTRLHQAEGFVKSLTPPEPNREQILWDSIVSSLIMVGKTAEQATDAASHVIEARRQLFTAFKVENR